MKLILKQKSLSKLQPAIATLASGTTVHINTKVAEFNVLPPLCWERKLNYRTHLDLKKSEIKLMQKLRMEDPKLNTVNFLAKKFQVRPKTVSCLAPCPQERLDALELTKLYYPEHKKRTILERKRRKQLW